MPTATPIVSRPDLYVYSGAAPNLTNLMTRNTFAGATFNLLIPQCRPEVWDAPSDDGRPGVPRRVSRRTA